MPIKPCRLAYNPYTPSVNEAKRLLPVFIQFPRNSPYVDNYGDERSILNKQLITLCLCVKEKVYLIVNENIITEKLMK